ncbi:MAG: ATP-binding cassette domain-containing protein, partial [Planctomycetota bacterium]|nr:ATP-binding cassette domain-containing protein [Planctomycetota bacterium]
SALALLGLLPPGLRARWRRMALAGQRYAAASAALRPLRGRGIGLVFQEPLAALNPVLPVGFQLAEVLRRHLGLARRAARAEAAAWLERVGLAPPAAFLGRHPHELSGGQRQRVAIALALAPGPPLLIADEPTSALDPPSADEILRLLVGLARERGTALLIVSHELELLARHCERLAVLAEGRIVESAAAAELLAAPREPATRRLVAARLGPPPRPAGAATAVAPEPLLRVRALRVERRARWLRR